MGIIEKSKQRSVAGFSLLELMVVVAILGALATLAVPRFNIFRARARQGEAKVNLDVIYKLQEAFKIEHEQYYNGKKADWGGADMFNRGNRQGYRGAGTNTCEANKLGFRVAECTSTRYGYLVTNADEDEFLAIAYGQSDAPASAVDKRIYPGCEGTGTTLNVGDSQATSSKVQKRCSTTMKTNESEFGAGDAWCTDENRNLENYRDITEFCNE